MLHSATEFCAAYQIKISPAGRGLRRENQEPWSYLGALVKAKHYADARRVLAHLLPKRQALWWACLCIWESHRPTVPPALAGVLKTVGGFVAEPTEGTRRVLEKMAQETMDECPLAGCLAMAAFCSGGSMAPPDALPIAPAPFLTGRLVGVTVYLASVACEPQRYEQRLSVYLQLGVRLARGELALPAGETEGLQTSWPEAVHVQDELAAWLPEQTRGAVEKVGAGCSVSGD